MKTDLKKISALKKSISESISIIAILTIDCIITVLIVLTMVLTIHNCRHKLRFFSFPEIINQSNPMSVYTYTVRLVLFINVGMKIFLIFMSDFYISFEKIYTQCVYISQGREDHDTYIPSHLLDIYPEMNALIY